MPAWIYKSKTHNTKSVSREDLGRQVPLASRENDRARFHARAKPLNPAALAAMSRGEHIRASPGQGKDPDSNAAHLPLETFRKSPVRAGYSERLPPVRRSP